MRMGWSRLVQAGPGWSRLVQTGPGWSRLVQAEMESNREKGDSMEGDSNANG